MSTLQHLDDHIIARYTAQPTRLPQELRREIEHAWQGAAVQLYALADLDQSLRLTETWLALGPRHIAVAKRDSQGWEVRSFERSRIQAVREAPGLSANTLTILGAPGDPALALLRYTHRQRRAFENTRFVLEEQLQGHARELVDSDADCLYAESVARHIGNSRYCARIPCCSRGSIGAKMVWLSRNCAGTFSLRQLSWIESEMPAISA